MRLTPRRTSLPQIMELDSQFRLLAVSTEFLYPHSDNPAGTCSRWLARNANPVDFTVAGDTLIYLILLFDYGLKKDFVVTGGIE